MVELRRIRKEDNADLAKIIRNVLEEFGVNRPGTVYTDPTTDNLFELFQSSDSAYFVAEEKGEILGGCGIFPTKNLPTGYAELVKLYLKRSERGKGLGKKLMLASMDYARKEGFTHLYLETMPELAGAIDLYRSLGYFEIDGPLGDSGHFACEIRMVVKL